MVDKVNISCKFTVPKTVIMSTLDTLLNVANEIRDKRRDALADSFDRCGFKDMAKSIRVKGLPKVMYVGLKEVAEACTPVFKQYEIEVVFHPWIDRGEVVFSWKGHISDITDVPRFEEWFKRTAGVNLHRNKPEVIFPVYG